MSRKNLTRRDALKGIGAGMASAFVAACAPQTVEVIKEVVKEVEVEKKVEVEKIVEVTAVPVVPSGYQGKLVNMSAVSLDVNQELVRRIEANWPGVTIEWKNLTSAKYAELFAAAELADDQMDIMQINGQDLRRYATGGKLLDASTFGVDLSDFREVGLKTYTIGGTLWALPVGGVSGFPFLYNKLTLKKLGVDKEPETYDDLKAMAPELKKLGISAMVHPGKDIYLWPIWQFWAYAQTTGNKANEFTVDTLTGKRKWTDPESVAALEMLNTWARDGMFNEGVNSTGGDAMWQIFTSGKALFCYNHSSRVGRFRTEQKDLPEFDMSLIPPLRMVADANVLRQLPGGTGFALGIYSKIDPSRLEIAKKVVDFMSSDESTAEVNKQAADAVSTKVNVSPSDDELALKFAKECAPNQFTYLDWLWPPEITRSFQEQQQAIVAGTTKPDAAAKNIQGVFDQLVKDGYKFQA